VQDVIFKPLKAEDVKKILNIETNFKKNLDNKNNLYVGSSNMTSLKSNS